MVATDNRRRNDDFTPSSGLTTRMNGMFYTADDTGNMRPVQECLKIECGRDFEKVARWNTIFNYCPYNGGRETHDEFWNGREFRVLLLQQCKKNNTDTNCWIKGKVASWFECNMGPGDRHVKWTLKADIIPTNPIGVGSLVYSKNGNGDTLAIIVNVNEDGRTCTMKREDGICCEGCDLEKFSPYDGKLDFEVHRLNVQGGGILKCQRLNEILKGKVSGFSMKWSSLVSQIGEDCESDSEGEDEDEMVIKVPGVAHGGHFLPSGKRLDDGNRGGCWYFDLDQKDLELSSLVLDEKVLELRRDHLRIIQDGESMDKIFAHLQKMLISKMASCSFGFRCALLSIPYHIYEAMLDYFLVIFCDEVELDDVVEKNLRDAEISESEWLDAFHDMVKVGIYLRQDKDWIKSNSKIEAIIKSKASELGGCTDDLEVNFDASLYRICNKVGEFFEDQLEFRAAIWCYNHNLRSVRDPDVRFPRTARNESLVSQLCYIGLANKRMDNFLEASRYYEAAITKLASHSSAFGRPEVKKSLMKTLTCNAKRMQSEAKEWFGTSGEIIGWSLANDGDTNAETKPCAACNGEGVKKCSACRVACYCNTECQSNHWTKAHKHTCLGKSRVK